MPRFSTSARSTNEYFDGRHRFEHWYRDNSIYFITARCRDRYAAFQSDQAKAIFWDRFDHYTSTYAFIPIVTSLLDNHYHTMGYVKTGKAIAEMMRKLHGSTAKLVNDLLPERRVPFWRGGLKDDYFDGCLRNTTQFANTYRYIELQSVRHLLASCARDYPHTRAAVAMLPALQRATQLKCFAQSIDYPRYQS